MKCSLYLLTPLALIAAASPAFADACKVVDGAIAELSPGPFQPGGVATTLKASYKAEFRWNPMDREAIGWMRITDDSGQELGWVPAGHEAVRCGEIN